MEHDERPAVESGFPATRWTTWVGPAQREDPAALASLLSAYCRPLRRFLMRKWRMSEERAGDLVQGFLTDKVLEKKMLGAADRGRGKFRTFLLAALTNYAIDQFRRERRDPASAPFEAAANTADHAADSPEAAFDREWARQIIARALEGMEAECLAKDRPDVWEVFQQRIVNPILEGQPEMPYEDLVARFRLKSPAAAFNLLVTGKRMFTRHLRATVGEYVSDEAEVDSELAELRRLLSEPHAR